MERKSSTESDLEVAIQADPNNLVLRHAYADFLIEGGNPRGEFIRLQLMLKDENLPDSQRVEYESQSREILNMHQREWLGPLARYLNDTENK